jgi:hypothetical protein
VDDTILTGADEGIEEFVQECHRAFKTRDLGNPRLFLGIQIEQRGNKVILYQRNYIRRILSASIPPRIPWLPR